MEKHLSICIFFPFILFSRVAFLLFFLPFILFSYFFACCFYFSFFSSVKKVRIRWSVWHKISQNPGRRYWFHRFRGISFRQCRSIIFAQKTYDRGLCSLPPFVLRNRWAYGYCNDDYCNALDGTFPEARVPHPLLRALGFANQMWG